MHYTQTRATPKKQQKGTVLSTPSLAVIRASHLQHPVHPCFFPSCWFTLEIHIETIFHIYLLCRNYYVNLWNHSDFIVITVNISFYFLKLQNFNKIKRLFWSPAVSWTTRLIHFPNVLLIFISLLFLPVLSNFFQLRLSVNTTLPSALGVIVFPVLIPAE